MTKNKYIHKEKKGGWDTLYSTYFWKINLDPLSNDVEYLMGHSQKMGEREAQDKDYLIRKKIINLYNYGYFNRSLSIEIYQRAGSVIDKRTDPMIIKLYPTHYVLPELNFSVINKRHGRWLTEFYDRINNGKDLTDILPAIRKAPSKDEHLDIHKQHLPTIVHLYRYSARLSLWGHPSGAVEDFIRKYKELKGW